MQQQLVHRHPESRSVERLGEAVNDILHSNAYQQLIPTESTTETWINTYPERHDR